MGLQPITQMLMLPKILHIEPTDFCNAACPQCARETEITFNKQDIHHLTVEQIKKLVSDDTILGLDKMYMCGVYGDPAAGKHTLEILEYFRSINPNITLGMNTNGSLRDASWWKNIADLTNTQKDYVVFSIDGLEDTNHIYRINTNWTRIMSNVQTYIAAGGRAHWDMLVFNHNAHQVDQAQELAKSMGFKWFRAKVSQRFKRHPVSFLQPPKAWASPEVNKGQIKCYALQNSSIYISARGVVYPCSWLGCNSPFSLDQFDHIQASWASQTPNEICSNHCTTNEIGSSFTNQWQREVEF